MVHVTRGFRNNNPTNIKDFGIPWQGIMPLEDRNADQAAEQTFEVFRAPWWGIRAAAVLLRNYYQKYGLDTVRKIINRWAPPADDNPTSIYVKYVAAQMRVDPDQVIDLLHFETMRSLVHSIVKFENGENIYSWEYEAGLILAGIEPKLIT